MEINSCYYNFMNSKSMAYENKRLNTSSLNNTGGSDSGTSSVVSGSISPTR